MQSNRTDDFAAMTEQEKRARAKELWDELKRLHSSMLRSDWHATFESILRMDIYERVLRKAVAYANFYIAIAERNEDVDPSQVTISIFRDRKNPDMFHQMIKKGILRVTDTPGIYHVSGYTDLPFQIVITSELEGEEYAAYRALSNHASDTDIETVFDIMDRETIDTQKRHERNLMKIIIEKNPAAFEILKRRDAQMSNKWMEVFKDELAEHDRATIVAVIKNIMDSLGVSADSAMDTIKIPPEDRATYASLLAPAI